MRLIATADLHYNIARSRGPTEALAADIVARGGDVLLLVGDLAGADKGPFEECLALFGGFPGRKLFVAGNHELWSRGATDALALLRDELPARGARHGFACLEYQPVLLGPVAIVGTVGWYDYSFRDPALDLPLRFYRRKVSPGAARYFTEHRDLLENADDLTDGHHELTARWMDGVHVNLPAGDEAFTRMLADKLATQLDAVAREVDRIVVAIHHVPFARMMPELPPGANWQFVAAYMGSELLGQACLAQPKVTDVICGHTHQPLTIREGHIQCHNVGSNYHTKRKLELEI
ncbi:MAG: hypothetical protein BIFFINMI_02889 [Phycisphaerae bacterium]|nr:hypothetical protein [Phycisphaerae bacterium]